jgi:hypothetical protein
VGPILQNPDRVIDLPDGSKKRAPRRLQGGVLLALALSAWSRHAASQVAADASPLTLDWLAPAGCPSREHVVERVNVILGRSTKPRGALTVRAIAAQSPSGKWRVRLAVDREGSSGSREFEAESCEAAADATALIVSLMIDPTAVAGAADADNASDPEKTIAPPPPAKPPPPDDSSPPEPAVPSAPPARPPLFAVRASLAGDVGTFSPASIGGELLLGVALRRLRFELAGSYWVTSKATVPGSSAEGAWLELATLGARAAYVFPARDLALAPLVGVEGDQMSATGFGGTSHQTQTASWVAVALGATGSWSPIPTFHAVALSLTLEAVVAVQKLPRFVATESGGTDRTVQEPFQIAGRAFLGVEYLFF